MIDAETRKLASKSRKEKFDEILEKIKNGTASQIEVSALRTWVIDDRNEGIAKKLHTLTKFANKEILADEFIKIQPLFYDRYRNWWCWNHGNFRWEIIDETDILNILKKVSSADTINTKERTEILEALKQRARLNEPKEIEKHWLQFKNMIYDIKTGETWEATPEYFVANPIPWSFHKDKFLETPVMDKLFEEWVGKEYVQLLYEILAYCMLPAMPINRLFCFIGAGSNGKGCFLQLLRKFIGEENCCATDLDVLLNSRFEVTKLHKKLVCEIGETNFNEIHKTALIKRLTGGQDPIRMEYKNKTPFDTYSYAKILIATNNLPTTTDKTIGWYRRWLIIDFPNEFKEIANFIEKTIPNEEYESLALKSVFTLKDLLEKAVFTNEGTVEERKERYESKSNFLEKFLKEFIEKDETKFITIADFNKKFGAWCKENRHREMSETTIGLEMKKLGIEQSKIYFSWMYDGKGGQARCWMGLKWK